MSRIVPFSFAVFAVSSLCLAANQVVHVKKSGAERVVEHCFQIRIYNLADFLTAHFHGLRNEIARKRMRRIYQP